jgi:O-antigen/teichoic acid export membrane protein
MANSFDTADRLMIVHFAGVAAEAANALVGQYHCSRVVPILMFQAAATLGAILLPHLCHDWEAGRHEAVSRRLNGCLKLTAWAFTATAIVVLLAAPLLFGWVLQGRYDQGLSVLPWTLTYCLWFSLVAVAQNYLWCAERAWLSSLALLFGLLVNVTLNFLLLPRWGLLGVVLASNAANAVTLVLVYRFSQRSGMTIERGTWLASGLPVLLSLGPWRAAVALLLVAWLAIRGNAFFCSQEKQRFFSVLRRPLGSLRLTLTEGSV